MSSVVDDNERLIRQDQVRDARAVLSAGEEPPAQLLLPAECRPLLTRDLDERVSSRAGGTA
jgi:hypothetical protein